MDGVKASGRAAVYWSGLIWAKIGSNGLQSRIQFRLRLVDSDDGTWVPRIVPRDEEAGAPPPSVAVVASFFGGCGRPAGCGGSLDPTASPGGELGRRGYRCKPSSDYGHGRL